MATTAGNAVRKFCAVVAVAALASVGAAPFAVAQAAAAAQQAVPYRAETVVVKLGAASASALQADPRILSMQKLFVDPQDSSFSDIYKISTTYSPLQIEAAYPVAYAQASQPVAESFTSVNNPGFSTNPNDPTHQWGLLKADFPDAWDIQKGSLSIKVAVIDTGIDGTHQSLDAGQVAGGYNFLTQTIIQPSSDSDDNGHGTLVAGVIGATPNNFRGITGADWSVTLVPLKALNSTGSGNSADVASAIVYATDHGANVINMSFGGIGFANDTTLSAAIAYAYSKNVVLVAAAGNDETGQGNDLDTSPEFPVCDNSGQGQIIGVAATDINNLKASFSDFGKACVTVSAPGDHILSTISFDPNTHAAAPNSYAYAAGTSLAVPFVTAEAVLIEAQYPGISAAEVRDRIVRSAVSVDALNTTQCNGGSCAGLLGSGEIDAFAALSPNLVPPIADGTLVTTAGAGQTIYYISGGTKEPVSGFVQNERFSGMTPTVVQGYQLAAIPTGAYAMPTDGTFVKTSSSNTVYEVDSGSLHPVTYQVFLERNISPSKVNTISAAEVASWLTTTFYPPAEGTLVKSATNPTVYWVVSGLLHPISYGFYTQRGLKVFPIMVVPAGDIPSFAQGNSFVL